ncbi:MAG: hypothetical protein COB24_03930 [Hyphomicrobiales bacterium]|nr:MAG: hypothetical protein COB24_03930 [Hyphomicrobiales bacterium]
MFKFKSSLICFTLIVVVNQANAADGYYTQADLDYAYDLGFENGKKYCADTAGAKAAGVGRDSLFKLLLERTAQSGGAHIGSRGTGMEAPPYFYEKLKINLLAGKPDLFREYFTKNEIVTAKDISESNMEKFLQAQPNWRSNGREFDVKVMAPKLLEYRLVIPNQQIQNFGAEYAAPPTVGK